MPARYLALAAGLFAVSLVVLAFALRPFDSADAPSSAQVDQPPGVRGSTGANTTEQPGVVASPEPTPVPVISDVARIVVPGLDIDAPIVTLGVDADGTMQSPDTPTDVAWYSFSGRPGERSNVVMAGHLDYVNHGPAVFYRLKEATMGDEVQLFLVDGSIARYRVASVTSYEEATAPVDEIVGPTDSEVVTLITCGGAFDPGSREYDKRVVLRAERIDEIAVAN